MSLQTLKQKLSALFNRDGEDRGVSPVIGVILMVAITVILAAVIGAFVLGLGDGLGSNPEATVSISGDQVQVQSLDADGVALVNETALTNEGAEIGNETATAVGQTMTINDSHELVIAYNDDGAEYSIVRNLD